MKFVVGVDAEGLLNRLDGLAEFVDSPSAAWREIADLFLTREQTYLRTAQWIPLKPDTIRRKLKLGRTSRPLLGGTLERSLTRKGAQFTVRRISTKSITIGTRHPLASIHDKGTRGALPRRPLISVSQADRAAYRSIFAEHLARATNRQDGELRGGLR